MLAERAGVELKPPSVQEQLAAEEHAALRSLLDDAVIFYHHNLFNTSPGKAALEYLHEKRSLKDETIEAFGLGYAPQSWEAAYQYFMGKGYSAQDLLDAGMVTEREGSGLLRPLPPPLDDPHPRRAGAHGWFRGAILNPNDIPKFINSPQTVLLRQGAPALWAGPGAQGDRARKTRL